MVVAYPYLVTHHHIDARSGVQMQFARAMTMIRLILLYLCCFQSLSAEVMDKEPSVAGNWFLVIAGCLIACVCWRWTWWVGLSVLTFLLSWEILTLCVVFGETADPDVGPAIRKEFGPGYAAHFGWATAVVFVFFLAILAQRWYKSVGKTKKTEL